MAESILKNLGKLLENKRKSNNKTTMRKERIVCNKCGYIWNCTFLSIIPETELKCPKCGKRDSRIF